MNRVLVAATPAIRLVAVDMDGTFLRPDDTYDRPRFARFRERLRERGGRFVVASGNQYEQLRSFFDDPDEFGYVSDNGALVADGADIVHVELLAPEAADRAIAFFEARPEVPVLASGPGCAYVPSSVPDAFMAVARRYYHVLRRVESLYEVRDRLFKFGVEVPGELPPGLMAAAEAELGDVLVPVSSGHGSLDLIIPGCHKASGLLRLMERWGLTPDEAAAFGDGGNDVELLRLVRHGVAMANAPAAVRAAAAHLTGPNTEDGVLAHLDTWFT